MPKPQPQRFKDYTRAYFTAGERLSSEKRDELILAYTPLIKYIATRLLARLPPSIALDDLISAGIIGLIDAIDKFDPGKNVQLKTYAEFRIRGAMLDELRSLDWVPRSVRGKINQLENAYIDLEHNLGRPATDQEVAQALGVSLDEFHRLLDETKSVSFMDVELLRQNTFEEGGAGFAELLEQEYLDPFSAVNLAQVRQLVAQAITALSDKEKLVVSLYYFEELTMKEIGLVLGYTESRICQMHSKAMLRLRAKLKRALT